ncbi:hypothetical protein EVAR_49206_1 [Eumeta japonica]|uniref:Uncharacterized protein n=1 Tax=Eumeta variegata TaxID=151549 RepID=A0A4C1XPE0_EUMVA|nr:hypothetical protein EVAR_49206_1 [Eumeta japonica]
MVEGRVSESEDHLYETASTTWCWQPAACQLTESSASNKDDENLNLLPRPTYICHNLIFISAPNSAYVEIKYYSKRTDGELKMKKLLRILMYTEVVINFILERAYDLNFTRNSKRIRITATWFTSYQESMTLKTNFRSRSQKEELISRVTTKWSGLDFKPPTLARRAWAQLMTFVSNAKANSGLKK